MSDFADTYAAHGVDGTGHGDVIQDALVAIRNHLGMEVAYFSEFVDGRSVFRRVDAPGLEHMIKPGDSQSLDDVYCHHILEGRLPELMPDTSLQPIAMSMPITNAVPIGSHVSIPIRRADGSAFGMFCCLSPRPNPSLNERDLQTMRVFAALAARQVNSELEHRRGRSEKLASVRSILAERAFDIVFQPIIELHSGRLTSYEALCRFAPQPYRSPDKWFADAVDVGLAIDLELAVAAAAVEWFPALPSDIRVSINASPETVASGRLAEALDPAFLDRTILELTEHAKVMDYAALHAELRPFKDLGMQIAVDDAGAGYSGLQHIVQLAPDIIKLDMSLTRGIDADSALRALASAMIFFARETGACVVAEGVETLSEMETLRRIGVNRGQGYFLGRPGALPMAVSRPGLMRV